MDSKGCVDLMDIGTVDDLDSRLDVAEPWLEMVASFKLDRVLGEGTGAADDRTAGDFDSHDRSGAFSRMRLRRFGWGSCVDGKSSLPFSSLACAAGGTTPACIALNIGSSVGSCVVDT